MRPKPFYFLTFLATRTPTYLEKKIYYAYLQHLQTPWKNQPKNIHKVYRALFFYELVSELPTLDLDALGDNNNHVFPSLSKTLNKRLIRISLTVLPKLPVRRLFNWWRTNIAIIQLGAKGFYLALLNLHHIVVPIFGFHLLIQNFFYSLLLVVRASGLTLTSWLKKGGGEEEDDEERGKKFFFPRPLMVSWKKKSLLVCLNIDRGMREKKGSKTFDWIEYTFPLEPK